MAKATLWFDSAWLADGWADRVRLTVKDGLIAEIESEVAPRAAETRSGIGIPGLPNLHSHAFQRAMAGLAEARGQSDDSFWTWRELMYRFVGELAPEDVEAIAAQAFMEMLETGFTRVGEFHYLHHAADGSPYTQVGEMAGRIIAAAVETGIGLTLLPVFYAHAGFGGGPPTPGQRRFTNDLSSYERLHAACCDAARGLPDAVVGVAPHSLRAVTAEELTALHRFDGPFHIHIAEQLKEVEDCLAWSGARPVEWLLDRFDINARWCLVHATHLTPSERRRLAESGAVAGLCPITEANLGDGLFPAVDYVAEGGAYGVGSDSNVRIDAGEELRLLEYGQRLVHRSRNLLAKGAGEATGAGLYRAAQAGGARALGQGESSGLKVGSSADIVSLDPEHEALSARHGDAWLDSRVFAGAPVQHVWRRGIRVVEDGRHRARDRIVARYRATMARLLG